MKVDSLCGYKFWHPKWMQRFATPKTYLTVYGLLGTIQSMSHMYIVVTLTTMEKRFKMPSETTGIILSGNEISQILLSVILSYYGGKRNRPRWISWGICFCAFSCFIIALPHFIYGAGDDALQLTKEYKFHQFNNIYMEDKQKHLQILQHKSNYNRTEYGISEKLTKLNQNRTLCYSNQILVPNSNNSYDAIQSLWSLNNTSLRVLQNPNESGCNNDEMVTYVVPLILVFLSQFVLGIGNSLYYALGQTYLDDNTSKTKTPLMLAFAMTLRMIGPIIGFFLGYGSLSLFIDLKKTPLISKRDPRWLGAWWFGWIILGGVMLIFAFLMGLFPKNMPQHKKNQVHNESADKNVVISKASMKEDLPEIKDFPTTLMRLCKNRLLICNIFSGIFYLLGALGYMTFLSKIMEVQFFKSRRDATITIGPMIVTGMVIGFLISGIVISRKKPKAGKLLLWNIIVGVFHLSFIIGQLFIYCDDPIVKNIGKSTINFTTLCNSACQCDDIKNPYNPVCDKLSGISYFSACHAGCKTWNSSAKVYTDCHCLDFPKNSPGETERFVFPGLCLENCGIIFMSFAILCMISNCLVSTGKIGNILVSFRAISPEDKSIAQGLTLMLVSLLASIPGPIIYGKIIDMTCLKWDIKCGKHGNCMFYDQTKFRYYVNLTGFGLTLVGVIFDIFVWNYGKNLKLYKENTQAKNNKEDKKTSVV